MIRNICISPNKEESVTSNPMVSISVTRSFIEIEIGLLMSTHLACDRRGSCLFSFLQLAKRKMIAMENKKYFISKNLFKNI